MENINELSFEQAYAELESVVMQLESGDLALQESVTLFERGRQLAAYCQQLLDSAELRISQLNDDGTLNPFASDGP